MKKFLSLLTLCALALTMLVMPASAESVTELSFWHSMSGENGALIDELCAEFNETIGAEQGIKIVPVYQGIYADVTTKVHALFAAEDYASLPDILQSPASELGYMVGVEQVVSLDDLAAINPNISVDDFEPKAVSAFSYADRHVGVPFANSSVLLYYNKDQFKEVGLDPEVGPATLAELGEDCAKLLVKDDAGNVTRYGFACEMELWFLNSWIGMQNSSYGDYSFILNNSNGFDGVATEVLFGEDGSMERLMSAWKAAYDAGEFKYLVGNNAEEFAAGAISMFVGSSASLRSVLNAAGDKFEVGVAYMPKVNEDDKGGVACGGSALYVLDNGKGNVEKSASFIEFMTSPEIQYRWHLGTGYFPVNTKVYDLDVMSSYLEENGLFAIAVEQLHNSSPMVREICSSVSLNIDTLTREIFAALIEGDYSVEEAVDVMVEETNAILATVE